MKTATIARIIRILVLVAIAVVISLPVASVWQDNGSDDPVIGLATPVIYPLEVVGPESMADSLKDIVANNDGCVLCYGDQEVKVSESNLAAVCTMASLYGKGDAVLRNADGDVILIDDMLTYDNAVASYMTLGLTMPDRMVDAIDVKVGMNAVYGSEGDMVPLPFETERFDKGTMITICVPYLIMAMTSAFDHSMGLAIDVSYMGLIDVSVDIPSDEETPTVDVMRTITELKIKGMDVPSGIGKVGDQMLTMDGYSETITIACIGDISESLEDSLTDGCLTISANGRSLTLDPATSEAVIELVDALEGRA